MKERQKRIVKICEICNEDFLSYTRRQRFCKKECSTKHGRITRGSVNAGSVNNTNTVGAISELIVGSNLLSLGYDVFRALSPSSSFDLVAVKQTKSFFIEVRTGYRSLDGSVSFSTKHCEGVNLFAVYIVEEESITYFDMDKNEICLL